MSFDRPRLVTASADVLSTTNLTPVLHQPLTTAVVGLGQASQSLLFVDRSIADYQQLLAGVAPGTEVHILDSSQDAIAQITNTLLGRHNISSLHIVSHGESGGLDFGTSKLNLTDLPQYAAQLQSWSKALTDDADLLLYGCNVAQGELGKAFTSILSQLTGADVAASDDLTGSASKGGNWTLEFQTGDIEATPFLSQWTAQAYDHVLAAFTPGNLVIYRVGNGSTALTSAGTPVFLDEYTTAGSLVQSIALPTTTSGSNRSLVASGAATSEGFLNRSVNGQYLTLTGYDAAVGTTVVGTASATTNRVVGRVDAAGTIDTTTALSDFATGGSPRSAVSTNGTDLWVTGGAGGVRYTTLGATTSTQLSTAATSLRNVNIFDGQLYASAQSGSTRVATVGTGTPTTSGQTITNLPGLPTSGSPYSFFFADLTPAVTGSDTLYVADDTANQIQKFSLVSGSWVANGSIAASTVRGLTGSVNGSTVNLFGATNANLYSFTDSTGYNTTVSGTTTSIATSATNTAFRGLAFAPVASASTSAAPTVTVSGTPLSYTENDPATVIDATASVADTDSTDFDTGTLTVNYSANGSVDDRLAIRNQGVSTGQIGVSGSTVTYEGTTIGTFTGGTGTTALVITFNASATPTAATALLQNLTYANVSEAPSSAARTVQFVVTDGDGGTSTAVTKTINVTAVNDVPTIALSGGTVAYTENAIATLIDGTATITDLDATNFNTGNLTINYTAGGIADDRLTIRNQGTGTGQISLDGRVVKFEGTAIGTYTGGIGTTPLVITFNSGATPVAAQSLLRAIAFSNVSQNPTTTARSLQVTVSDGIDTSTPATRTINVTAVNDAPIVGNTTVLYNGASGALPSSTQGWLYGGPGVTPTVSNGATNLNTTGNSSFAAGFSNSSVSLDRTAGYVVSFNAQVVSESRTATADKDLDGNDDRAGFSIIVVSSDNTKAIELGFLSDRIFAQEDGTNQVDPSLQPDTTAPNATRTLFTQAEAAAFTTSAATNYDLAVKDDTYTLFANGTVILSGRLRDYTAFSGTPDPYQVPNQIFFGDDTTSAAANLNLSRVSVTTNPATLPSQTVNEDTAIVLPNLFLTDLDAGSNPVTLTLAVTNGSVTVNNVSGSTLSNNGSATVTVTGTLNQISAILTNATGISYQGNANYNGSDTLTLSLNDNGASGGSAITTTKTLPIVINSVNDAPSFTKGANQTINEDAVAQSVSGWATNLSAGAANESGQTINFLVSNNNNALFSVQPTIDATGKLTYTAAPNANGTATVTVQLQDNGGVANNGVDTSAAQTFTITVNAVNDAPSFTKGADQTVNEDAEAQSIAWATNLSTGATNESSQTLTFLVSNNNTALFAVQPTIDAAGQLTYTAAPNANGTATVTVQLQDNGGVANGGVDTAAAQTFTITVNAVNDAPTLTGNATLSAVTQNATNPSGGTITSLFGSLFSDIDTGASLSGLAIVGNAASSSTQGQWQYALDGTTWNNVGTVAEGATALALAASTRLRFLPVPGYNGTPTSLTVRALDNTYSGGFSTDSNRVTINTTNTGGSSAIAGGSPTALTTSVVPLLPQLVWRNSGTGQNAVWQLNTFTLQSSYFLPSVTEPGWQIVASADLNHDGTADLVWRNQRTGANALWELDNTGYRTGYFLPTVTDRNWQIASAADVSGDGTADLVWRNVSSGANAIWQLNGFSVQTTAFITAVTDRNWQLVSTADFNQDGTADLLWRNASTGANAIWQMNNATLQSGTFFTAVADPNWQIIGTGNFDGDATPDIVWRNKASGENAIWQMQGATLQSGFLLPTVADANWQIAGVADLGGDSTPELLWHHKPAGQTVIWQLNGFSYTTTTALPHLTDPNWSVKPFVAPLHPPVNPN